jgi:hypothetical protein
MIDDSSRCGYSHINDSIRHKDPYIRPEYETRRSFNDENQPQSSANDDNSTADTVDTSMLEETIVETLAVMKDIAYGSLDILEMEYHNRFEGEYLRNNKSKAIKNIRCFPSCCQNGTRHIASGFCGSSIRTTMILKG